MKKICLVILVLVSGLILHSSNQVCAQYYTTGNDPSDYKWQQISSGKYPVIFPDFYGNGARTFADLMQIVPEMVSVSMASGKRGYPVIIHPGASFSNGITILAPRRVELYPKHPVSGEIGDFASQLIIHEARHMAQMDRLNSGFTKFAGYLLGEQAQAVVLGLHIPAWFLEGDATLTETLLSDAGRGRMPSFSMPLRTRLLAHELPGWDPMALGSYKHYYPSEYLFGYYLTARARMLSYPMLWSDALGALGRNPFQISGFTTLFKRKTGLDKQGLYLETMRWLSDFWFSNLPETTSPDILKPVPVDTSDYFSYIKPYPESGGSVVCLKRSLSDIPKFVRIHSDGKEVTLIRPGSVEDANFTIGKGLIAWCENNPDIRWENRTYSDLYLWSETGGQVQRIAGGRRLFSPALDQHGTLLSCVSEEPGGTSELLVIDLAKGSDIQRIPVPAGEYVNFQCWGRDSLELFMVTTGSQGRCLLKLDRQTGKFSKLLDGGYSEIGQPSWQQGYVYFTAPSGATTAMFRIKPETGSIEKTAEHFNGISTISAGNGSIGCSVHYADGFRPYVADVVALKPEKQAKLLRFEEPVTATIARAPGEDPIGIPVKTGGMAEAETYGKFRHLFNFHSWAPVFIDPEAYRITPGLAVMSQNDLSTLVASAGYQYNRSEDSHGLTASVKFSGFYPVLEAEYFRGYQYVPADTVSGTAPGLDFYRQNAKLRVSVPVNFSSGIWTRRFSLSLSMISDLHKGKDTLGIPVAMTGLSSALGIYRRMSYRDLFPRFGFVMSGYLMHSADFSRNGWNRNLRLMLYLPGGLTNSSLHVLGSVSDYSYSSFLDTPFSDIPRGSIYREKFGGIALRADYSLPVAYPDWSLSWILYVKRIKANIFFDSFRYNRSKFWDFSTGIDLTADFHILRMGLELEGGIRALYFPLTRKLGAEFLYSFSIQ